MEGLGLAYGVWAWLACATATAVATLVLSRSRLLRPLRSWLLAEGAGRASSFLGELLSCTFCTSIWVAAAAWGLLVWRGALPLEAWYFVNPLTVAALAGPIAWLLYAAHAHMPQSKEERS